MTRTERLLRLAKLRGDRAAVAIIEADKPKPAKCAECGLFDAKVRGLCEQCLERYRRKVTQPTETELRALWGDR